LLVERKAPGGQAGASSRIENYLGFPNGISGDDLSQRAFRQAIKFGAEVVLTREVREIIPQSNGTYTIGLDGGDSVDTKTVILATGVDWRRLEGTVSIASSDVESCMGLRVRRRQLSQESESLSLAAATLLARLHCSSQIMQVQ
jgi:thioredoxin reductase